jgi:hypothetical protein
MTKIEVLSEEKQMRALLDVWARARWGASVRIIHELALGDRRADLVVVAEKNLIAIEIKSSSDKLDRLADQVKEYGRYVPEVWAAVAMKWQDNAALRYVGRNLLIVDVKTRDVIEYRKGSKPYRDELVYSRLIEILWRDEAARIAQRTGVIPGTTPCGDPAHKIKPMLARLLTGNEILRETCTELRTRPLVGIGSDGATR